MCCAGSIYLVERGNCSFVDKYQAVMAAGGAGMIMYDDLPGQLGGRWQLMQWLTQHGLLLL
jgi:hypothetical protein